MIENGTQTLELDYCVDLRFAQHSRHSMATSTTDCNCFFHRWVSDGIAHVLNQ